VPADRLVVKDGVVYFRADANHRGKIGFSPRRANRSSAATTPTAARSPSCPHPAAKATDYVNSMWNCKGTLRGRRREQLQRRPACPGAAQLGKFYELETSSPASPSRPARPPRTCTRPSTCKGTKKRSTLWPPRVGRRLDQIKSAFKR